MVKINRSPLPAGQTIARESDYTDGPLYETLKNDFHEKCYICEDRAAKRGIEIDHRIAHKGDSKLKYNWNNLFFSCHHCNRLKNACFNSIIDCTQIDPEDYMSVSIENGIKTIILITKLKDEQHIDETIRLLNRVYNGENMPIMRDECIDLRKDIQETVREFNDLLESYDTETDTEFKNALTVSIKEHISRQSTFAAFKRGIAGRVWRCPMTEKAEIYYKDIGDYLSREQKFALARDAGSILSLLPDMVRITPNEHGNPRYIRDVLFLVITVNVKTVDIVAALQMIKNSPFLTRNTHYYARVDISLKVLYNAVNAIKDQR